MDNHKTIPERYDQKLIKEAYKELLYKYLYVFILFSIALCIGLYH